MQRVWVLILGSALASVAAAGDPDDFLWRDDFTDARGWTGRPGWLANPSSTASANSDGQVGCFRVDEARRGMKWSCPLPQVFLEETPWLVVRYRAENLQAQGGDYLIYLDDHVAGRQLCALRFSDAQADGRWHVVAVDISALTAAPAVDAMAVQVQASAAGGAGLWIDWLAFLDAPPNEARVIDRADRPSPAAKPDWSAPLAKAAWIHHDGWLGNPAAKDGHGVETTDGRAVFRVRKPARGMKWSWALPESVGLEGRRYVAMRYRATGLSAVGDYALCVLGKRRGGGDSYASVVGAGDIVSDGRWHTLVVDIRRVAGAIPEADGLAIQVQAGQAGATLEVAEIRLVNAVGLSRLADMLDWKAGAQFEGTRALAVEGNTTRQAWCRRLRLADWFTSDRVTAQGIPFQLVAGQAGLAGTGIRAEGELRFRADVAVSEVYLLALASFLGAEEPMYGEGRLRAIRDVDRFRLRLEYDDGTADECLPMNVATKQFGVIGGLQVLVAAADPSKKLRVVVLADTCRQGAFAVAALTVRTAGQRTFPEALEDRPPLRPAPVAAEPRPTVTKHLPAAPQGTEPDRLVLSGTWMEADVRLDRPACLTKLLHRPTGWSLLAEPCELLELYVDGRKAGDFESGRRAGAGGQGREDCWQYRLRRTPGLRVDVRISRGEGAPRSKAARATGRLSDDLLYFQVTVWNGDTKPHRIRLVAPRIGPFSLCDRPEDAYYLVPKCGSAFDNRPCSYRQRYSGLFPVQFLHAFSPATGRGLVLQTTGGPEDLAERHYVLEKKGGTFRMAVGYPERTLGPRESFRAVPAILRVTDGDWHRGLESYRAAMQAWHRPAEPRKQWFREVFNFRQRFLHSLDGLYDPKAGTLRLDSAVAEAQREFGGIDYLHLFDWGNCGPYGRIYGRTGDYSPFDYLNGGREALRKAIAGVQTRGVPVGLYIEGYLLTARGKLGQRFGKDWQIAGADGKGRWWPGNVEMMVCPAVPAWREVQASTYETKVRQLGVDGMYIDQFGFAGAGKDCYAVRHGHPVPSYCVRTERDMTKLIRQRVGAARPGVALYTEETPVDVTTQYQDGSFTYAMLHSRRTETLVPLNLARFAFPDFKTIEILFCDRPTGSWATGVRWVFFNGEAIWLEGPAEEWFARHTRAEIRRCYRILRKHRDAFTGLTPVPLVPTETGGVYANRFTARGKTVYTLYNARNRTVRGVVLRRLHSGPHPLPDGVRWYDEWHERPAAVRREAEGDAVSTELGPHGVGCLVASW